MIEFILQILQLIIAILCICVLFYILKDLRHKDDDFIVHEVNFDELSDEEQKALFDAMERLIDDD